MPVEVRGQAGGVGFLCSSRGARALNLGLRAPLPAKPSPRISSGSKVICSFIYLETGAHYADQAALDPFFPPLHSVRFTGMGQQPFLFLKQGLAWIGTHRNLCLLP